MRRLSTFIAATTTVTAACGLTPASAAEKLIWNHNVFGPPRAVTVGIETVRDVLEKASNGNLEIKIAYGSALGPEKQTPEAIKSDGYEGGMICAGYYPAKFPLLSAMELPFVSPSDPKLNAKVYNAVIQHPLIVKEMAERWGVRLALGATRGHLLKQLLTESVVLAIVGGAVSLFVAWGTLKGMAALLPADAGETFQFSIRPSMIAFSGILALVTGLLFGLFPALHSTRADLITTIRAGAGQLTGGRAAARFRNVLVTLQIALSTALLVSAGLFTKSLANVSRVDLGVSVDNVVTFAISPLRVGYDTLNVKVLYGRIEEELRAIPGVRAVSSALVPLLGGNSWGNNVRVQGFECLPDTDCNSRFNAIGAGYFASMGSALLSGREFTESDAAGGPRVAVVNRAFAEKFNLGTDAVGKFMSRGGDSLNIQIVGLLPNIKYNDVKREPQPVFYLPWAQERFVSQLYFYLRTSLPPAQLVGTIPGVLKRIDATLPVEELRTMPEQIRENIFMDRLISILSAAFAVLATLLAAVGLYGVLAYSVSQRTREIGVRMALGADGARVRGMVLRQVGLMILIGSSLGIAGAIGLGRAASSLLYGLEGSDPLVFALAVALLALIALGAGFMPALRASRTNPMQALRYD
jgi:predicted permease